MNGHRKAHICVIGASMLDVVGQADKDIIAFDSNPGAIYLSPGGVSRNISENLARLGANVELMSVICTDPLGAIIQQSCIDANVSIQHSYFDSHHATTTYSAFLEPNGKMHIALSDTRSLDQFPLQHIIDQHDIIEAADIIVIDAALPQAILAYIFDEFSSKVIFVDPVSIGKAESLPQYLSKIHTLKCNQFEAAYLSQMPIQSNQDIVIAAQKLIDCGMKQVFITLGEAGVYYHTKEGKGFHTINPIQAINVTGAGDAFMAGLVYAYFRQFTLNESLRFASATAKSALLSMSAVNPYINLAYLHQQMEEET